MSILNPMICKKHGRVEGTKPRSDGYRRCKRCAVESVQKRQREIQTIPKLKRGGKCELCGYSKCLQALEWHHIDSQKKEFSIGSVGYRRSLKSLEEELEKCVLLRANCHREVEYKIVDLGNLAQLAEQDSLKVEVMGSIPIVPT